MSNRPTKRDARNRTERPTYLPTTFRFTPLDMLILDALVRESEGRLGRPTNRAELLRALIRTEYTVRISETLPKPPKPKTAVKTTKPKTGKKVK